MNYYGIVRRIYKNNKCEPCETVVYHKLYKTLEDATRAAMKDLDFCLLHYGHKQVGLTSVTTCLGRRKKNGDYDTYRHEWDIEKYQVEGE